jgi:hypothetical protein
MSGHRRREWERPRSNSRSDWEGEESEGFVARGVRSADLQPSCVSAVVLETSEEVEDEGAEFTERDRDDEEDLGFWEEGDAVSRGGRDSQRGAPVEGGGRVSRGGRDSQRGAPAARRGAWRGRNGRSAAPNSTPKGRNFFAEEERQLTRSVLAISQDPITGNQQKSNAFWQRIYEHYDSYRPGPNRSARSLETKWGQIKHDVGDFVACHGQVCRTRKSGSSPTDILCMAKELYRSKHPKQLEFSFEHCWVLVREFPRWSEGWFPMKPAIPTKRKAASSGHDSHEAAPASSSVQVDQMDSNANTVLQDRPSGTKAAKREHKQGKVREGAMYAQAKATSDLASATLKKMALLEEQNLLILMTTPESQVTSPAAQQFLRIRQEEELEKLLQRREEDRDRKIKEAVEKEIADAETAKLELLRQAAAEAEQKETARQLREVAAGFSNDEEVEGLDSGEVSPQIQHGFSHEEGISGEYQQEEDEFECTPEVAGCSQVRDSQFHDVSVSGRAGQGAGTRAGQGLRGKGGRRGMARAGRQQSGGRTDAATLSSFAIDVREGSFVLGYGGGGRGNLQEGGWVGTEFVRNQNSGTVDAGNQAHSSSRLPSREGYFAERWGHGSGELGMGLGEFLDGVQVAHSSTLGGSRSQGLSAAGVFARASPAPTSTAPTSTAPTSTAPTHSRVPDSAGRGDHFLHDVYSQSRQWESVEQLEQLERENQAHDMHALDSRDSTDDIEEVNISLGLNGQTFYQ